MFTKGFSGTVYDGSIITCEVDGFTVSATIHSDDDATAPWDREDGHGPVSDWRTHGYNGHAAKEPGERPLNRDRHSTRFYDFAAAVKMARRDGWGFRPAPLVTKQNSGGRWCAWFGSDDGRRVERFKVTPTTADGVVSGFMTEREAVTALYAAHRATMTPGAYAAAAATADFDRLKAWCDDQWQYVGVSVTVARNGITLVHEYEHAVWGIESDAPEYLTETANELLSEALQSARDNVAALCA